MLQQEMRWTEHREAPEMTRAAPEAFQIDKYELVPTSERLLGMIEVFMNGDI